MPDAIPIQAPTDSILGHVGGAVITFGPLPAMAGTLVAEVTQGTQDMEVDDEEPPPLLPPHGAPEQLPALVVPPTLPPSVPPILPEGTN